MSRVAALLLLALVAGEAAAAACEVAVTDMAFGAVTLGADDDAETSADVTIRCSDDGGAPEVGYEIAIGPGLGGSFTPRAMRGPGELAYNLYVDPARTVVWGDGAEGTLTVAGALLVPTLDRVTHTVYGRIPSRQRGVEPGTYRDILTITLNY